MKQHILPATDSKLRNKNLRANQIEKKIFQNVKETFF